MVFGDYVTHFAILIAQTPSPADIFLVKICISCSTLPPILLSFCNRQIPIWLIDSTAVLWYISFVKSCDEDMRFGKILREEPVGARFRFPAASDTTSEPTAGNGCPGAPVIASMSGGLVRNQGGTVEY